MLVKGSVNTISYFFHELKAVEKTIKYFDDSSFYYFVIIGVSTSSVVIIVVTIQLAKCCILKVKRPLPILMSHSNG